MANYAKGTYVPKHPEKYIGKYPIIYRSSWEFAFIRFVDQSNPYILFWASETIEIPYKNPLKGKFSIYIPDFLIGYMDKNNKKHCELIEIKPEKQMPGYQGKTSTKEKLQQAINAAKWQAALAYCAKRNWMFRVINEKQLFAFQRKS